MGNKTIWLLFGCIGVGTFVIRLSFIQLFEKMTVPEAVYRLLRFVPPAVLSALIFPAVFMPQGAIDFSLANGRIAGALAAALAAFYCRNALLTIGSGMAAMWIMRACIGS